MKMGWTKMTLDEACHFSNGLWKGNKAPFLNVGVIRNTNFRKDGSLDDSDIAYLDVEAKKFEKRRLQYGDIILEKSGGGPKQPVGRVALFDKQEGLFSFSNFTSAMRVKAPQILNFRFLHKFLYWTYLSGVTEGMQSHSTGIRNLDGNAYKSIEIAFPSLHEQQRIVTILDEAFEAIAAARANAEQNRQNARALFESYLQSVFSQRGGEWEKTTLEKVLKVQPQNGWSPPAANHSDSGTPVLTLSSVTGFQFKADKIKFTSAPTNNMGRYWVKNGDLLITRSNTPNLVGHVAIASDINQPTIYPDLIMRMNPDPERVMTEFLYFQLRTPALRQEIMGRAQGANPTMKKISNGAVKTLPIVVPRLETQSSIAQSLNQLTIETQRLESLYQRKIAALDELKQSLLQQAFSGNL